MATYSYGADFSAAFAVAPFSGELGSQTLLDLMKLHLGIDPGDTTNDEALTRAINMAGDIVENYLGRVVTKREVLERWPHHFGTVTLRNLEVDPTANVTVYLNGVVQSGYSIFLMNGGLAYLTRQDGRPDVPMDWRAFDQVSVTYTAGYDPLPSDLANAIVWTAALIYQSEGTGTTPGGGSSGDVKSMTIYDVGSMTYDVGGSSGNSSGIIGSPGVIPDTAAQLLTHYKRLAA